MTVDTVRRLEAELWGGRHDGAWGNVTINYGGPTEVIEWPVFDNPPTPTTLLGEWIDPTPGKALLKYRLDPSAGRERLLYRLEVDQTV